MPEDTPFSQVLREATRGAHDRAQESTYVVALLDGSLSLAGYGELAKQYYFIYGQLEAAAAVMRSHPVAGPFVSDALNRVPALTEDLPFLLGDGWPDIEPNPATRAYCDRLAAVARTSPTAFVAHHYTRYLGDIAGGQVIRARLGRQHGVTGVGARFYDFAAIGGAKEFRDHYRSLLDNAPWSERERRDLVDEARVAYELNTAVFVELERGLADYLVA